MIHSSKKHFYIKWENEYSEILVFSSLDPPGNSDNKNFYSGPFNSLNEAKKTLIPFLENKISYTRENLQKIRALKPEDFMEKDYEDL